MLEPSSTHEATPAVLQADRFETLVGRDVRFGDTGVTLVLVEIERSRGPLPDWIPRAPFTLTFTGPKRPTYLAEGLYRCDFGDEIFEIHVAPIHTPSADRQDYQAVFN